MRLKSDMLVEIKNEYLCLTVETMGAEMQSLVSAGGTNYLWTGDSAYWSGRSPVLFPFVGRLYGQRYRLNGKEYPLGLHGFAKKSEFTVKEQRADCVVLSLRESDDTLKQFPFRFAFRVGYTLRGRSVEVSYEVDNLSDGTMYFGLGGHPGFNVPFEPGTEFEDYYLRFSEPCSPELVAFSDSVLLSGKNEPYELEGGQRLPLRHELFDLDAVVLKNTPGAVTIASDKSRRSITVAYPQMPYVGFWQASKKQAPYLCIEPWVSLPGREGLIEDFENIGDLIRLEGRENYTNIWTISIEE